MVDQIRQLLPPETGEIVAQQLANPSVRKISYAARPDVQLLIDSVFSLRQAHPVPAASATSLTPGEMSVRVALVQRLSDSTATAELRRRVGDPTGDMILLREGRATPGALAAALRALARLRETEGVPALRSGHVVIHGESHPRSWRDALNEQAGRDLATLAKARPVVVQGIGSVRSITIYLAPRSP
ncbi:MAG TPA: hypothetical protein VG916_11505 [Gemmatimonadaceae bacterium]|nr:hypothetical protein [Gemmatimonadaceae bacterium]